jgi:hypothetical protein
MMTNHSKLPFATPDEEPRSSFPLRRAACFASFALAVDVFGLECRSARELRSAAFA